MLLVVRRWIVDLLPIDGAFKHEIDNLGKQKAVLALLDDISDEHSWNPQHHDPSYDGIIFLTHSFEIIVVLTPTLIE